MTANQQDPLLRHRDEFPALAGSVYLVSHSLGAMPRAAADALAEFGRLWVSDGINAWARWLPMVNEAGDRIARLLGADPGTVVMLPNVSAAQAVIASCLDYEGPRNGVVYSELEFPTVSYVWKSEERRGARVTLVGSDDGIGVATERMLAAIDERTLLAPVSHVLYRSAFIQDVAAITRRAHEVGALVCADLYQSLGTVPLSVKEWDVDFACGGSVKWLCGGPGAAYLYVRPDLLPRLRPRVTGWFGNAAPFAFHMPEQEYAPTTWRMLGGTPAVASLYHARPGAELIGAIGVPAIREKSQRQTARIVAAVDEAGWTLRSPRAAAARGGSVCFDLPGAAAVAEALCARKFFCDHRPGAGIRVSPHFYTTDDEIDAFFAEARAEAARRK
jgi:kynureninase